MGFEIEQTSRLEVEGQCCLYKTARKELGNGEFLVPLHSSLKPFVLSQLSISVMITQPQAGAQSLSSYHTMPFFAALNSGSSLPDTQHKVGLILALEVPEAPPDAGGDKFQGLGANGHHQPWLYPPSWTRHPLLADTSEKSWKSCHMRVTPMTKAVCDVSYPIPSSICLFLPSWTLTAPPNIWAHSVTRLLK